MALPAPNAVACDFCGGLTTRAARRWAYCSATCRSNAHRWLRWKSVPREPAAESSLWSRSPRRSADDRPKVVRHHLAGGAGELSDLASSPVLRELRDAVVRNLRDGAVSITWSVHREVVE